MDTQKNLSNFDFYMSFIIDYMIQYTIQQQKAPNKLPEYETVITLIKPYPQRRFFTVNLKEQSITKQLVHHNNAWIAKFKRPVIYYLYFPYNGFEVLKSSLHATGIPLGHFHDRLSENNKVL